MARERLAKAPPPLTGHPVLFGRDPTAGIVAVEEAAPGTMAVWRRVNDRVTRSEEPFAPLLLVTARKLLSGFKPAPEVIPLEGPGTFRFLVRVPTMKDLQKLQAHLRKASGKTASAADAPYWYQKDPVHLYLLATGRTLFKGMTPEDPRVLALDIETATTPGYGFSNPERSSDRIVSIAVADNRGFEEVIPGSLPEPAMLERLAAVISERDPDVITGHNLFRFDLTYLASRAAMHGVTLAWGRDESPPRAHNSRLTVAERILDYPKWEVAGRHVIDTYILTLFYDVATRELESLNLKEVARALGVAAKGRAVLDGSRMAWYLEHQPKLLAAYNLDDVRETLGVYRALGAASFVECQVFPWGFQNVVVRGMATKINALLLREYFHRGAAIPAPPGAGGGELEGGLTALYEEGVLQEVFHVDVKSLYPSIILADRVRPAGDHLGVFLPLLGDLADYRFKTKELAGKERDPARRLHLDALQRAVKVLINSFYGLLASGIHPFSDLEAAARVTERGRKLITAVLDRIRELGLRPIEADTDGVFFRAPGHPFTEAEGRRLLKAIAKPLPRGITLELDGLYPAMFSHKVKNYALLEPDGRLVLRGSGLKSRGIEPYLRSYLREAVALALEGRGAEIGKLHRSLRERLEKRRVPVAELSKTETLTDSLAVYREKTAGKKRNPAAAYELALASGRDYRPGDQVSWYVTGNSPRVTVYRDCRMMADHDPKRPDENVPYYLAKLDELHRKFLPALSTAVG